MSTAYVAQVSDELAMCSRYDFSIYSYESDLAIGFEYRTTNKEKTETSRDGTEKLEGLIKARIGFAEVCHKSKKERADNHCIYETLIAIGIGTHVGRSLQEYLV